MVADKAEEQTQEIFLRVWGFREYWIPSPESPLCQGGTGRLTMRISEQMHREAKTSSETSAYKTPGLVSCGCFRELLITSWLKQRKSRCQQDLTSSGGPTPCLSQPLVAADALMAAPLSPNLSLLIFTPPCPLCE